MKTLLAQSIAVFSMALIALSFLPAVSPSALDFSALNSSSFHEAESWLFSE